MVPGALGQRLGGQCTACLGRKQPGVLVIGVVVVTPAVALEPDRRTAIDIMHDAEQIVEHQWRAIGGLDAGRLVHRVAGIVGALAEHVGAQPQLEPTGRHVGEHLVDGGVGLAVLGPARDLGNAEGVEHRLGLCRQRPIRLGHGIVGGVMHGALLRVGDAGEVVDVLGQQRGQALGRDASAGAILANDVVDDIARHRRAGGEGARRRGADDGFGSGPAEAVLARLVAGAQERTAGDAHGVLIPGLLRRGDLASRGGHLFGRNGARLAGARRGERIAHHGAALDRSEDVVGQRVEQALEPFHQLAERRGRLADDIAAVGRPDTEGFGDGLFLHVGLGGVAGRVGIDALGELDIGLAAVRAPGLAHILGQRLPRRALRRQHAGALERMDQFVIHDLGETVDHLIGGQVRFERARRNGDDVVQVHAAHGFAVRRLGDIDDLDGGAEQRQGALLGGGVQPGDDFFGAPGQRRRGGAALRPGLGGWLRYTLRRHQRLRVTGTGIGVVALLGQLARGRLVARRVDGDLAEQVARLVVAVLHHGVGGFLSLAQLDLAGRAAFLGFLGAQFTDLVARLGARAERADGLAADLDLDAVDRRLLDHVFAERTGRQVVRHGLAFGAEHVIEAEVVLAALHQLAAAHHGIADRAGDAVILDARGVLDGGQGEAALVADRVERLVVLALVEGRGIGDWQRDATLVAGQRLDGRLQHAELRLRHAIDVALAGGAEGQFAEGVVIGDDVLGFRDGADVVRHHDLATRHRTARGDHGVDDGLRHLGARHILDGDRGVHVAPGLGAPRHDTLRRRDAFLACATIPEIAGADPWRIVAVTNEQFTVGAALFLPTGEGCLYLVARERTERRDCFARRLQQRCRFCLPCFAQRDLRLIVDLLLGRRSGGNLLGRGGLAAGDDRRRVGGRQGEQRFRRGQRQAVLDRDDIFIRLGAEHVFADRLGGRLLFLRLGQVADAAQWAAENAADSRAHLDALHGVLKRHLFADDASVDQRVQRFGRAFGQALG